MGKIKSKSKLILGVSGSIAAYKVCELVRSLKEYKFGIRCVLTEAGQKFITKLTLQTLSNSEVYTDLFAEYSNEPEHISLAENTDLITIVPGTADIIARLATGQANDLLTSLVLATKAKILICPAMNTNMWTHPVTQRNVEQLKKIGYYFVGPEKGRLASGKEGIGRLASIDKIAKKIIELTK